MLPPPVKGSSVKFLRILTTVAREVFLAKAREVIDDLEHEKAGFAYHALKDRMRELEESGKPWTDEVLDDFMKIRLPAALKAQEAHAMERRLEER